MLARHDTGFELTALVTRDDWVYAGFKCRVLRFLVFTQQLTAGGHKVMLLAIRANEF